MSKKLKRLCALICTAVLMLSLSLTASAGFLEGSDLNELPRSAFDEVPMYANGEYIGDALKLGSISYAPIPDFCEELLDCACRLRWDSENVTLTVICPHTRLVFDLYYSYLLVNDRYIYLEDGLYNVEGVLYVPVRALAKAFDAEVEWADNSISISCPPGSLIASGIGYYNEYDLYWLSRVIYAESGNQSMEGMIGVGNVVLNRVRDESGIFPDDVRGVIFQPGQFSVVDSGSIFMEPKPHCVVAAKLCLEGYNTVGSSLFFLNPSISNSYWFDTYRVFYASIGDHDFYA